MWQFGSMSTEQSIRACMAESPVLSGHLSSTAFGARSSPRGPPSQRGSSPTLRAGGTVTPEGRFESISDVDPGRLGHYLSDDGDVGASVDLARKRTGRGR